MNKTPEASSEVVVKTAMMRNQQKSATAWSPPSAAAGLSPPLSTSQSQTQEILTQNPDLTQMGTQSDDEGEFSQDTAYASPMRPRPWGRLIPVAGNVAAACDLLDKEETESITNTATGGGGGGFKISPTPCVARAPGQIFNEYVLGRSLKCDVQAVNPSSVPAETTTEEEHNSKHARARQNWAFGMISNRHCKIYCMAEGDATAATNISSKLSSRVWIEDCSANGTLINQQTLLRRGQKRLLHTGDEISLVNPETLRKKVRSAAALQRLVQQQSFVFTAVQQQQAASTCSASLHAAAVGSSSYRPPPRPRGSGTPAVNVRATRSCAPGAASSSARRTSGQHHAPPFQQPMPAAAPPATSSATVSASTTTQQQQQRSSSTTTTRRCVEHDYDLREVLGSGTVGQVRRAIHRQTGQERAIKIIAVNTRQRHAHGAAAAAQQESALAVVQAEATLLQSLSHPYIVHLHDVYVSDTAVYLVMDLLRGGDLLDRILLRGNFSEAVARRVFRRLLAALHYLHVQCNIVHRDLKPENILLVHAANSNPNAAPGKEDYHIQLTDFGLAKSLNGVAGGGLKTFCGTPQYFAPEVLQRQLTVTGKGRYGPAADVWSLGVILYVLLTGTLPPPLSVVAASPDALFQDADLPPISTAAQDLVRRLLQPNPADRWTVPQACQHEWILQDAAGDSHVHPLDDPAIRRHEQQQQQHSSKNSNSGGVVGNSRAVGGSDAGKRKPTAAVSATKISSFAPAAAEAVAAQELDHQQKPDTETKPKAEVMDKPNAATASGDKSPNNANDTNPEAKTTAKRQVGLVPDAADNDNEQQQPPALSAKDTGSSATGRPGETAMLFRPVQPSSTSSESPPRRESSPARCSSAPSPTNNIGGSARRPPLSPVQLNNDAAVTPKDDDGLQSSDHDSKKPAKSCAGNNVDDHGAAASPGDAPAATSTLLSPPWSNNPKIVGRVSDEMAAGRGGTTANNNNSLELSDDEVFSRFSEQTESISSFTSTTEAAVTGENSNDTVPAATASWNHPTERQAAGAASTTNTTAANRRKKRRVTDTMGDSLSRLGFSSVKKAKVASAGTASNSNNKSTAAAAGKAKKKKASKKDQQQPTESGKKRQAKLSQWFKSGKKTN